MRRRVLVFVLALIAVLVGYYFLAFSPQSDRIKQATTAADTAEAQVQKLKIELARREELQARAPQLREQAKTLDDAMPNDPQLAQFILQVQDSANVSGIEWLSVSPTPPAAGAAGFQVVALTMSIEGGYFQVQDFLVRLETLSRAVKVDVLTLTPATTSTQGRGSPKLGAALTMKLFVAAPPPPPAAPPPAPAA